MISNKKTGPGSLYIEVYGFVNVIIYFYFYNIEQHFVIITCYTIGSLKITEVG